MDYTIYVTYKTYIEDNTNNTYIKYSPCIMQNIDTL